jgi:hypothetical protein
MDLIGWLTWLVTGVASLAWFLIGGWVSALAQIAVAIGLVFAWRHGWRQAPIDIARLLRRAGSFAWAWLRAGGSEREAGSARVEVREVVRTVRVREPGDVNLSTLLSLVMLAGLGLLALAR